MPDKLDKILNALAIEAGGLAIRGKTRGTKIVHIAKAQILANYRSLEDIRKAVGELEADELVQDFGDGSQIVKISPCNQLRKDILTNLGIEEK